MFGSIFAAIELILKLLNLWDSFLSFMDAKHAADLDLKRQEREKAADDLQNAKDESGFDDAQDRIVDSKP